MVQSIILVGSKTRNQLLVLVKMDSASRVTVVIKTLTSFVQVIIGPTFVPVPAKPGVTAKQESLVANSSGDKGIMVVTLTIQLSVVEMASVNTIVGLHRDEILKMQTESCKRVRRSLLAICHATYFG